MIKWETSGENNRNHFINGSDNCRAILVYVEDERKDKRLNKLTRKYETKTIPKMWRVQLSIQKIIRFKPFYSEKEALKFAEELFIDCVEQLEKSTSHLRSQIK